MKLSPRHTPRQERSIQRSREILETTAALLDRVGFDDLTTILIARELNMSVGTLYHYFPNKHAIMHAIAEQWLTEYSIGLDTMELWRVEEMSVNQFCEDSVKLLFEIYQSQRGMLPLVTAITAVPELRELDAKHDQIVVKRLSLLFQRLGLEKKNLKRLAVMFLETNHALLVTALGSNGRTRKSMQEDIVRMLSSLLSTPVLPSI